MLIKKKGLILCIAISLAVAIAAACLWYARPMTIEELCPGLDMEQCTGAYACFSTYDDRGLENRVELPPGEESPLLELFQGRKFKRSPLWWFPSGTKTHRWQDGDFRWSIDFAFQDAPVTDFSTATGYLLHFNNFFGELEIQFTGKTRPVSTAGQEQWLKDVMDYLLTLDPNTDFNY